MTNADDQLASYVPQLLRRRLAHTQDIACDHASLSGAVLCVDVVGFTSLTERLVARGPAGAEELTGRLQASFGRIVSLVADCGGDVLHFAGDAIIAFWPASSPARLADAIARAFACGMSAQQVIAAAMNDGDPLRLRGGVGAGSLFDATLGGVNGQWCHTVAGAALAGAHVAAASAKPGEVALSTEAARYQSLGVAPSGIVLDVGPAIDVALLEPFLPREVLAIDASNDAWVAEFRRVSVMFVRLPDVSIDSTDATAHAHRIVGALLACVQRFDGSPHQLVADDKGLTFIAAWGLPRSTHEDDASRASLAALEGSRDLTHLGVRAGVGVATGLAFCGTRGAAARRQYAMLGDVMNLASRLADAASVQGAGALCDDATLRAASTRVVFGAHDAIVLKGKQAPVDVARPVAPRAAAARAEHGRSSELLARDAEVARLEARLDALGTGAGGVVIIEGEAGIGKSQLLRAFASAAEARHVRCVWGAGDAVARATPWLAWRAPFAALFAPTDDGTIADRVLDALDDDGGARALISVLDALLPVATNDTAEARALGSDGRAAAVRDLGVRLLAHVASSTPLAVVIDDAHWIDSASWALLGAVARRVPNLLLVVSTRPMPREQQPAEWPVVVANAGEDRLALGALPYAMIDAVIARALGATQVAAPLATLIRERSGGNPFFVEQLALSLRDAGRVAVDGDIARLLATREGTADAAVPTTLQGVVAGRVDQLPPSVQITLKAASAVGERVSLLLLAAVHPARATRETLDEHVATLARLDFMRLAPSDDDTLVFRHAITRDVAYDAMAFAQRRPLHSAIGEWYEHQLADSGSVDHVVPRLAHHWTRAGDATKALPYIERAAQLALEGHANEEVVRLVEDAIAVDADASAHTPNDRRATWELYRGEALLKLSRYTHSHAHLRTALRLLDQPVPYTRRRTVMRLGSEIARQIAHRVEPRAVVEHGEHRDALLMSAHMYQRLAEIAYWEHDAVALAHGSVASLNLAERGGASPQLQLAYHVIGFAAGLAGVRPLWRHYRALAANTATRIPFHAETHAFGLQLDAIYFNGQAEWVALHESAIAGADHFTRLGDRFRALSCHVQRAYGDLHRGRLTDAKIRFEEIYRRANDDGLPQVLGWSAAGLLSVALARSTSTSPPLDTSLMAQLASLLERGMDHSDAIMAHGVLAACADARGLPDDALASAARATALIDRLPPASFHTLTATSAVAALHLDRWALDHRDKTLKASALHAVRGLSRYALACPVGRSRAWLARGRASLIRGRQHDAIAKWERARAAGDLYDQSIDAAHAHAALAAFGASDAAMHEREARRLLDATGAALPSWLELALGH